MPHCPSYKEMDDLEGYLKHELEVSKDGCAILVPTEANLVIDMIIDNRQMRKYIQKQKETINKQEAELERLSKALSEAELLAERAR